MSISALMKTVVDQKRVNLQEVTANRFKGSGLLKEAIYVTSDVGTAGFSVFQGISVLTKATQGMKIAGSVCGLVGGVLDIGQGIFVFIEGLLAVKNGRYGQAKKQLAAGGCLVLIGLIMTLVSIRGLGVDFGPLSHVVSLANSPYAMPVFVVALVGADGTQIVNHGFRVLRGTYVGAQLKEKNFEFQWIKDLSAVDEKQAREIISQKMEEFSEDLGVEGAIEAMDLLRLVQEGDQEKIDAQFEVCKKAIDAWNRMVALRGFQMSLYFLTFPMGLASSLAGSKLLDAVSKFSLTIPSSIGAYMDSMEPYKRNGATEVPKVQFAQ